MFTSLFFSGLVFSANAWIAYGYTPEAIADQIKSLPGAENLDITFNQFSGYLNINASTGKNIHYWFVESEKDPANAPLVFWTNGGPGCSGLIGFMTEQGPFRPNSDLTLTFNDYAWNKIANMVFIEQPSGVGFSYSVDTGDYHTNDQISARDNYLIIQAFLDRFPEYAANDLHTTAESYGGHYMPEVAQQIVNENSNPNSEFRKLNYKGFAVGNPFTDHNSEYPAMFYTYYGHQLLSKPSWDNYQATCINTDHRNYTECEIIEIELGREVGNLNPYAMDYPVCNEATGRRKGGSRAQMLWALNFMLPEHMKSVMMPTATEDYEPCADDYASSYLNRDDVKQAIHVDTSIAWEECASIRYNMADRLIPMQPIYKELLEADAGLKLLVYSGDDDAVCGTIGTQEWIWDLGYSPASKRDTWVSWMYDNQVAGYSTLFDVTTGSNNGLSFVTVHHAGHEVPTYVPAQALDLFEKYLNGYWFEKQ